MRLRSVRILLVGLTLATVSLSAQASGTGSTAVPALDPSSDEPIDLLFPEPSSVIDIYRAMGKAWGINFLFDAKLRDRELAIELYNVTPREAIASVLRTVGHFYAVVDPHTLLIADDTPQNRRTYEHQVIQAFHLENSKVADMMTVIRSLIGAKHVAAIERSNSIVLRDTADKVRVAEQIIQRNDRPRAEVIVDVDLLSVDRKAMTKLNLKTAADSVSPRTEVPTRLSTGQIDRLRQLASTRVLAQPKLDIIADSTAELRLTDRLPIPGQLTSQASTTDAAPLATVYQEIGFEVKLQPWVHNPQDVTLRVEIAAETLTDWGAGPDGEEQPVFGGIELTSKVRLRDGETYLMTGLMIAPKRTGAKKDSFLFGRFLHAADSGRELVLALTPHVIRGPGPEAGDLTPLWVGTESSITLHGASPRVAGPSPGPLDPEPGEAPAGADRESVRERLRERLRSMPRGLQDGGPSEQQEQGDP